MSATRVTRKANHHRKLDEVMVRRESKVLEGPPRRKGESSNLVLTGNIPRAEEKIPKEY